MSFLNKLFGLSASQKKAFFQAIKEGNLEMLKKMLKGNSDLVFMKDIEYDTTPLQVAATFGHKGVVELLLSNGAEVNYMNRWGYTALILAAKQNHKAVVELLLDSKAEIKARKRLTALHWAAEMGHKDMVELLLANNADVNAWDDSGETPLHKAAYNGHIGCVRSLLTHGAWVSPNRHASKGGETPLDFAVSKRRNDVAELLRRHSGSKPNSGQQPAEKDIITEIENEVMKAEAQQSLQRMMQGKIDGEYTDQEFKERFLAVYVQVAERVRPRYALTPEQFSELFQKAKKNLLR